jgi:succinoglycan biosynthesis transport protein ExoP
MDAWRIYYAAKRHKYLVVLSVLVAAAGAVIVSLFLPKYYVATTTLLPSEMVIRQSAQNLSDPSGAPPPMEATARESRVTNLVALAASRTIAERVARRMHTDPVALMRRVDCDRVNKTETGAATDMIGVSARMSDPESAVEAANLWANEFIKFHEEVSHREAVRTREFLEELMGKSKAALDAAASDMAAFRKQNLIADLPGEVDASLKELSPLRSERDELRARVADIGARLSTRRSQARTLSPTVTVTSAEPPTATIEPLKKSIGDAKTELIKLSQTYTDDYYRVRQLKTQIAAAQAELDRQQRRTEPTARVMDDPNYQKVTGEIKDLEADSRAGQARLVRLDSLISERETKMGAYSGLDAGLAQRKRAYDEAEKRYITVGAQVHTARINERLAAEAGAIKLIDTARNADGPLHAGPSLAQLVLSAVLLGLIVGLGIVVTVETLDTRVRTSADASDLLELPVSGIIPRIPLEGAAASSAPLVTHNSPMSPFAESYRFFATEVLLDTASGEVRSIMVATAKPSQGGTSTICNLAITLAQAGKRVVLIDADLRRPSLHRLFGVPNDHGLAELLRNGARAAECLKATKVENLALVTAGTDIDNPWALLRSARLHQLIDELKRAADYVLVDVPSAIVFADATTVASVVDAVIVVVRANESPRGSEFQIKGLLNKANANILGVVLNDVPPAEVDSCHYYGHYYATPNVLKTPPRGGGTPSDDQSVWGRERLADGQVEDYALDEEGRT